ncbi:MAG: C-GCAxxG-C-C family protein [Coriobacteriia bacterium]|nr:C-GCAxxG-C-C family protein [Coriobacteriia bacterium]
MKPAISPSDTTAYTATPSAASLYDEGYYCSEAIVKFTCDLVEHPSSDALVRMATGFGAGVGRTQAMCGALAGMVMAMGLLSGRSTADGPYLPSTDSTRELAARFEERHGTVSCADIVAAFGSMDGPGRHEHCREIVDSCAEWVRDIGQREGWLPDTP